MPASADDAPDHVSISDDVDEDDEDISTTVRQASPTPQAGCCCHCAETRSELGTLKERVAFIEQVTDENLCRLQSRVTALEGGSTSWPRKLGDVPAGGAVFQTGPDRYEFRQQFGG